MNQVAVKVLPALATGCTMVLKPPQLAPYSAQIFAEVLDKAGVPAGVFNMLQGSGSVVGAALSTHAQVDLVSITGSRAEEHTSELQSLMRISYVVLCLI